MLSASLVLATLLVLHPGARGAEVLSPADLASKYGLTTSTSLPFPTATLESSAAQATIVGSWGLGRARIQDGADNLAFVKDPYPNSNAQVSSGALTSSGPVLQVTYPQGSYSHDTGGAQFYNLWNSSSTDFLSMAVSYEFAFEQGFDWVKGGKLPGLRGGLNSTGCSGGKQPTGDCFSARLMWRKNANGESASSPRMQRHRSLIHHFNAQSTPISQPRTTCAIARMSCVTATLAQASTEGVLVLQLAGEFVSPFKSISN